MSRRVLGGWESWISRFAVGNLKPSCDLHGSTMKGRRMHESPSQGGGLAELEWMENHRLFRCITVRSRPPPPTRGVAVSDRSQHEKLWRACHSKFQTTSRL